MTTTFQPKLNVLPPAQRRLWPSASGQHLITVGTRQNGRCSIVSSCFQRPPQSLHFSGHHLRQNQ